MAQLINDETTSAVPSASAISTNSTDSTEISKIYKGTIVKYIHGRNYGFIRISNIEKTEKKEIFFHKSHIIKSNFKPEVKQGDKCQFAIDEGIKGSIANNIIISYRPIPKIEKRINSTNIIQENEFKATLFTKTMLEYFRFATSTNTIIEKSANVVIPDLSDMEESMSLKQIDIEEINCCFEEIIHSQKELTCSSCKQNLIPITGKEHLLKCQNCSRFVLSKSNNIQTSVVIQI
ncbi:unnamed protein product, partial [Rotaria sordida]